MSTDTRPTYRPSVGRDIDRVSVAISADSIGRHSVDRCLKYTWSKHFITGPKGNFFFSLWPSIFPSRLPRRTSRVSGKQNLLSSCGPVIKCLMALNHSLILCRNCLYVIWGWNALLLNWRLWNISLMHPRLTKYQDRLVLSTGLIMWIGHHKEIRKLTFQAAIAICWFALTKG